MKCCRTKVKLAQYPNIDGIVSVTHTEGGTKHTPLNNLTFVLRALCGWAIHPNIGAMLVIDDDVGLANVPAEGVCFQVTISTSCY